MSSEMVSKDGSFKLDDQLQKMNMDLRKMMQKSTHAKWSSDLTELIPSKYSDSEVLDDDYLSIISDFNSLEQCSLAGNIEDQLEELLQKLDRQSMMIEDFKSNELRDLPTVLNQSDLATLIEKLETLNSNNPLVSVIIGSKTLKFEYKDEDNPYTIKTIDSGEEIPLYLLTPKSQKEKARELPCSVAKLEKELSLQTEETPEIDIERKRNRLNNLRGEKAIYESIKTSKSFITALKNMETVGMIKRRQRELSQGHKRNDSPQIYDKNFLEQKRMLEDLKEEAKLISKRQNFQKIMLEKKKQILFDKEKYLAGRQQCIINNWLKEPTAKDFIPALSLTLKHLEEEQHLLVEKKEKFYGEIIEFQNAKVKIESELKKYNTLILKNQGKFKTVVKEIEKKSNN